MRGSAAIAAVPSLTALALLVAFPEPILSFLFGGSYGGAAPMIRILAIGYLLLIVVGNPINVLALTGRHRTALSVNVMAAIIVAVGGPLATARFGAAGLAWTTASALSFQYALQWWLVRRQAGVWTHIGIPRWKKLPGDEVPDDSPNTPAVETPQPFEAASCSCSPSIKADILALSTSQSENEQRLTQP